MRRLLILLSFLPLIVFSQNTYVPDDNFEQSLIDLGYDTDSILNDSVPTSQISNIAYLDIHNDSISDLTGIEDFTALVDLLCGENQLTSLDLSFNTSLDWLDCQSNQLTSINLNSNNLNFKILFALTFIIFAIGLSFLFFLVAL